MVARSTDACANDRSIDRAARSTDRADPAFAHDKYTDPAFYTCPNSANLKIYNNSATLSVNTHQFSGQQQRQQVNATLTPFKITLLQKFTSLWTHDYNVKVVTRQSSPRRRLEMYEISNKFPVMADVKLFDFEQLVVQCY